MKPRFCESEHKPPSSYGDCVRACVATLTDDDNVPHVFDNGNNAETAWKMMRAYLASKNKKLVFFPLEDISFMEENNPDIPYMLCCSQVFGGEHAVVGMNGKVIHDPARVRRDLVRHRPTGYWLVFIIA